MIEKIFEILQIYPRIGLIVIASLVSLLMVIVYKYTTNQERMKEIKDLNKKFQEEMKKCKDNPQKMLECQKKVLALLGEMMNSSFIPMLITMLPLFVLIAWLRNFYAGTEIAKSWIWYYIGAGIVSNALLRKVLKVH